MTSYTQILDQVRSHALNCGRNPETIQVIAVSKTHSVAAVQSVYDQGCRDFGENRVQEALEKIPQLPMDCQWHLIGTLQKNKIKKAVANFKLIHSVDTLILAQQIAQLSQQNNLTTSILLQLNLSQEPSKHGLIGEEWEEQLPSIIQLSGIQIEGLMTIAPLTSDQTKIRAVFKQLRRWHDQWRSYMPNPNLFQRLSMGMSNDYLIAIEEGATLLRIGSAIFGSRS